MAENSSDAHRTTIASSVPRSAGGGEGANTGDPLPSRGGLVARYCSSPTPCWRALRWRRKLRDGSAGGFEGGGPLRYLLLCLGASVLYNARCSSGSTSLMTKREYPAQPLVGVGGVVIWHDRALLVRR